jgi:type IV pilus assembly protein PilF
MCGRSFLRSSLILALFCLAFLQSCQYNAQATADKVEKARKRLDATNLNIQLGLSYLKQGDVPRAKRKLLIAKEIAPESAEVNGALAYYYEKTGDLIQAKQYYQKALSLSPTHGAQLNNYGAFLCRLGHYVQADAYFLKAVQDVNYVNTAAAYENAGLCAAEIPDNEKAKAYFIKALEQDPRRNQSLFELVSLELKQGNLNRALTYLQSYQAVVLNNRTLLALALETAHKAGNLKFEAFYKQRMSKLNQSGSPTDDTGEKNEHDSSNG